MNLPNTQLPEAPDTWEGYAGFATGGTLIEKYYTAVGHCMAEAFRILKSDQPEHFWWENGLDIACGDGKSTRLMGHFCRQLTGVDSSSDLIHQARQLNESDLTEFVLTSFEDYSVPDESLDVVGATWFLNHVHTVEQLQVTIEKIKRMLRPAGVIAMVVPADSFTSQRTQTLAREHFGWRQAWTESNSEFTRGVFSFGNEWIETTIWQPMFLARILNQHFDIRCLDVKSTLINQHLMDEMQTEPPFEVLFGVKRPLEDQAVGEAASTSVRSPAIPPSEEKKSDATTQSYDNSRPRTETQQRSYSAGSTSCDENAFRLVKNDLPARIAALSESFPKIKPYLNGPIIVSAYPASLGLDGLGPMVDTFLHPPAFFRALSSAADENRNVVITSQPLAGMDLMLQALDAVETLPRNILWSVGGYYLPESLEQSIRNAFASRGTTVDVLHCYGVAELAHTCLAATERDESGWPRFHPAVSGLDVSVDSSSGELVLHLDDRRVLTGDQARRVGDSWQVISNVHRLDPKVRNELESWSMFDWTRRTGYLHVDHDKTIFQMRSGIKPSSSSQLSLNEFWQRFGGSWTVKPNWGRSRHSW